MLSLLSIVIKHTVTLEQKPGNTKDAFVHGLSGFSIGLKSPVLQDFLCYCTLLKSMKIYKSNKAIF